MHVAGKLDEPYLNTWGTQHIWRWRISLSGNLFLFSNRQVCFTNDCAFLLEGWTRFSKILKPAHPVTALLPAQTHTPIALNASDWTTQLAAPPFVTVTVIKISPPGDNNFSLVSTSSGSAVPISVLHDFPSVMTIALGRARLTLPPPLTPRQVSCLHKGFYGLPKRPKLAFL